MTRALARAAVAALFALLLSGCIDSASPILTGSQDLFGPKLRVQLYALRKGYGHEPVQATYAWNGNLYAHAGGSLTEVTAFSVHPFEAGDYIIQAVPAKRPSITDYAILHKLAEGVFQVIAIDEADADEPTRAAYCRKAAQSPCRIETQEQLFAFARATAARRKDDGALAIRLPAGPQKPERRTSRGR